ncbi:MAG: lysoplasmalogenase family protein [Candidatus Kariarchaeaceae archaeon]|jgi:hypothetical protein
MTTHLVPMGLYVLSLLFLIVRLISGKKRDFIISVAFIVLGSLWQYFTLQASILLLFLLAIIFSFLGDLLMAQWIRITEHRTVDGVMAFGLAHIVYALAFNRLNFGWFSLAQDWWYIVVGLALSIGLFQVIGNNQKLHTAVKIANLIYAVLIIGLFMIVLGFVLNPATPALLKLVSLLGILSFMLSDGILAYNEFQKHVARSSEIVHSTYIIAQILLQSVPLRSLTLFT